MKQILDDINLLVKDQHVTKIEGLSADLRKLSGGVASTSSEYFISENANTLWKKIIKQASSLGLSNEYLSGLILGVASGMQSERAAEIVELVWSGPNVNFVPVRRSEQVLIDLIDSAVFSLHLVSFVFYNVERVEASIEFALDRGVKISMLIETERNDGSANFRKTAEQLKHRHPRMDLYYWPISERDDCGSFASMHGKSFVADGTRAFITSANLTSAALDRNIEIGVLVDGGGIPVQLVKQFDAMVSTKIIDKF